MNNENGIKSCPGSEILEEYRDGTASEEWMSHIDNCESCQRRIASLDLLDLRIRSVCEPPAGMAERIKKAVHEGREPSIKAIPFWRRPWFRAAASASIVVLLLSATVYFAQDAGARSHSGRRPYVENAAVSDSASPENVDAQVATGSAEETGLLAATAEKNISEQDRVRSAAPSTLSFDSNLRLAGTMAENSAASQRRQAQKQPLGNAVRHLWSVEDTDAAHDFIQKIAKANDRKLDIENVDGGFNAFIELKDTELQQLVDMLDSNGWRLLSPYIPQPREADAVKFRNIPVLYYINVIEGGK